jgi:FemAB-related protein (PEP-CTERM system-associated)
MKVVHCTDADANAWDAFLRESPGASFYHLFAWKGINERSFGHRCFYLAATQDDRIIGILPLVYIKSLIFGKILCSMPFVNFGGPCVHEEETERALLREAEAIVHRNRADYLEIRGTKRSVIALPTSEHKVSMTVALQSDADNLWTAFDTKHRREIRHAYKQGLHVKHGGAEHLDVFYEILSESWKSLGTPLYDKSYFRGVIDTFPDSVRIFIAYHGDMPISAAMNGYHAKGVEGMWLGTRSGDRRLNPGYVLYWEMIKHACESGFETFHLGRSTVQSGGEFFKKKWNAYPTQLYWQYILGKEKEIPHLNVDNPKYRIAIEAWKWMPRSITQTLGPFLARSIA